MARRIIASGILWLASQTVARQAISFLVFIVLGRVLAPADFGIVSLSISLLIILQALTSQGISQAIIQDPLVTDAESNVAYTLNLMISIFIFCGILVTCFVFTRVLHSNDRFWTVFPILGMSILISALYQIQQARLIRDFDFSTVAKKTVLAQIFGGAVGVGCALWGLGVWSLVLQQFVILFTELAIVRRASRWTPQVHLDREIIGRLAHFGVYLFGARFLTAIHTRGIDIIIGAFTGSAAVGYFRIAWSMSEVALTTFGEPIQGLALPVLSSKQAQPSEVVRSYLSLSEATAWLVLPPFLTLIFWAPAFIDFLFGAKWQPSGWILQILATKVVLYAMFNLNEPLLVSLRRTREVLTLRCWQTGIGLGIVLAVAPLGLPAIVLGQVIGSYLAAPVMFLIVARAVKISVSTFCLVFLVPFLSSIAFLSLALALQFYPFSHHGLIGLMTGLAASYALYCVSFLYFAAPELRLGALGIASRLGQRLMNI